MCQQAKTFQTEKEEMRSESVPRVAQISELLRALREVPRASHLTQVITAAGGYVSMNHIGESSAEASARLVLDA